MTHEFYPSILGRMISILISMLVTFLAIFMSILMIPIGEEFAADGIIFSQLCLILVFVWVALLCGFLITHFLKLAFSPLPSLIIRKSDILYRSVGFWGYGQIGLKGLRINAPKGMFKHIRIQLLVPKSFEVDSKRSIFYKTIIWVLKLPRHFSLLKFSNQKKQGLNVEDHFHIIHVYLPFIGVSYSDIKEAVEAKLKFHQATNPVQTVRHSRQHEKVVVRVRMDFQRRSEMIVSILIIACVGLLPLMNLWLGSSNYISNLKNDTAARQAQMLRKLAIAGDPDAQNKFGWHLSKGRGVPKSDARAINWYRSAAKQGFAKAQYNLGRSYNCKSGKKSACEKAANWFRKAADQNLDIAQSKLGYYYYKGWGVKQSYATSRYFFEEAARQNNAYSLYFLGFLYEKGRGVAKSESKALHYYEEALKHGYSNAKKAIKRLKL